MNRLIVPEIANRDGVSQLFEYNVQPTWTLLDTDTPLNPCELPGLDDIATLDIETRRTLFAIACGKFYGTTHLSTCCLSIPFTQACSCKHPSEDGFLELSTSVQRNTFLISKINYTRQTNVHIRPVQETQFYVFFMSLHLPKTLSS